MHFVPKLAFAIAAALAGPALAEADPARSSASGRCMNRRTSTIPPVRSQGIAEAFNDNVYEALFRLNDDGSVVPVLAAAHTVIPSRLTHTFTLYATG